MRRILAPRQQKQGATVLQAVSTATNQNVTNTLEFALKRKIYSMAAEKAAADGVICGYEEPEALEEARRIVLLETVVKATTFEELKAVVTLMLDSNEGLVEGLAEINHQLNQQASDSSPSKE
ncbi:MAG: hypothetical protein WCL27_04625 [Betaproteobacteria bacterium]